MTPKMEEKSWQIVAKSCQILPKAGKMPPKNGAKGGGFEGDFI